MANEYYGIAHDIFNGLPTEADNAKLSKIQYEKLKLKESPDVPYNRVYMAKVFGDKSKSLERDDTLVAKIPGFLQNVFDAKIDDENSSESYNEWRDRMALTSVQIKLRVWASGEYMKSNKLSVETLSDNISKMKAQGKLSAEERAKLLALLAE